MKRDNVNDNYGGLERKIKELGVRPTDRQTDRNTQENCFQPESRATLLIKTGIQLFASADLLSIEIGCLPRRMR